RSRRIESLVLEREPFQLSILRRPRRVENRRVAFAQRHHVAQIVKEGKHLAVSPDAALRKRRVVHAPLAPEPLQPLRIGTGGFISRFQQTAARGAVIDNFADIEMRAARRIEAREVRLHGENTILPLLWRRVSHWSLYRPLVLFDID